MPKLTDTQLIILSAAAARDSRAILPLPKSLKANKGAATSVLKGLLAKGLVEEQPAPAAGPAWRQDEDGRPFTLAITDGGIAALYGGPAPERAAAKGKAKPKGARGKATGPGRKARTAKGENKRPGSKVETILALLTRPGGARISELEKATGWQPHSVRAALTGLRKRGVDVTRERNNEVTTYRAKVA